MHKAIVKKLVINVLKLMVSFSFFPLQDTRTHIVVELFNTEKSYVESLETVVKVNMIRNFT